MISTSTVVLILTSFGTISHARDNPRDQEAEPTYDIRYYGAAGDGKTLCTDAIQKAIDACAAAGGGRVLVPQGKFITGSLMLRSNVNLYLEVDATLVGSAEISDYTSGVLIQASGVKNVSISGGGVIDGNGRHFWNNGRYLSVRPDGLIRFTGCQHATLSGVRLVNSPKFTVVLDDCKHVSVDRIHIKNSLDSPNTDGVDIVNSSDVVVSGSYIETGDDAVCLKSTKHDGVVERVIVRNCRLVSDDTALKLGTGSRNRISDCIFTDIVIPEATNCIGLFMKDGGVFERIRFEGISMRAVATPMKEYMPKGGGAAYWRKVLERRQTFPIFVDSESRKNGVPAGTIRDVEFKDLDMETRGGNCLIQGRAERPLQDIRLINIKLTVLSERNYAGRTKPRGTHTLPGRAPNDFANIPSYFTFAYINGISVKNLSVRVAGTACAFPMYCIWANEVDSCTIQGGELSEEATADSLPATKFLNIRGLSVRDFRRLISRSGSRSNGSCCPDDPGGDSAAAGSEDEPQ